MTHEITEIAPRRGITSYPPRDGAPRFLSDVIIELGLVDSAGVDAAVEAARGSGQMVGAVLVARGALTEEQLAGAVAARYGLDYVDLNEFEVDPFAANLLPQAAAQRYRAVPVAFEADGSLLVSLVDPSDSLALSDIAFMTKLDVRPVVAADHLLSGLIEKLPLPLPDGSEQRPSPYATVAAAGPAVAEQPEEAAEPDTRVEQLEAELGELRQELEARRGEAEAARAEAETARADAEAVRAEAEAARGEADARLEEVGAAERRAAEARETIAGMRQEFELEREAHAASERELRARLEAAEELRAKLLRVSEQIAAGARELAQAVEQPAPDTD
jgi:type II secretion system (T2SS) protein E